MNATRMLAEETRMFLVHSHYAEKYGYKPEDLRNMKNQLDADMGVRTIDGLIDVPEVVPHEDSEAYMRASEAIRKRQQKLREMGFTVVNSPRYSSEQKHKDDVHYKARLYLLCAGIECFGQRRHQIITLFAGHGDFAPLPGLAKSLGCRHFQLVASPDDCHSELRSAAQFWEITDLEKLRIADTGADTSNRSTSA